MSDKQERIARALERIADALERYNRAVLYQDPTQSGTQRIVDGRIRECAMIEIAGGSMAVGISNDGDSLSVVNGS